jgi:hypothetical protein
MENLNSVQVEVELAKRRRSTPIKDVLGKSSVLTGKLFVQRVTQAERELMFVIVKVLDKRCLNQELSECSQHHLPNLRIMEVILHIITLQPEIDRREKVVRLKETKPEM